MSKSPTTWRRSGLALAALLTLGLPLAGCWSGTAGSEAPGPAPAVASASPTPGAVNRSADAEAAGTPAERFAACLREHGVDAIAQGEEVLIAAAGGSVSTGGADAPDSTGSAGAAGQPTAGEADVDAARTACAAAVPDYRAPDHNER